MQDSNVDMNIVAGLGIFSSLMALIGVAVAIFIKKMIEQSSKERQFRRNLQEAYEATTASLVMKESRIENNIDP